MCFLEIMGFQVMTLISGFFSTKYMAAHAICANVLIILYVVPTGINRGCSTRVGTLLGKGKANQARRAAYLGILYIEKLNFEGICLGFLFSAALGGVLVLLSWDIAAIWTNDPQTMQITNQLLKLTALVSVCDFLQLFLM
jgi:Na+-driven multidrug efflux pump